MLVREFMNANPIAVHPGTPLLEAEWKMQEGGFRHLPVVDADGAVVGVVSDRDVREAAPSGATGLSRLEIGYLLSRLTVQDVMSSPAVTARPEEPAETVAIRLRERKIGALPVVERGRLVGMISTSDLLDALVLLLQARRSEIAASR